jgi:hypothetical protein
MDRLAVTLMLLLLAGCAAVKVESRGTEIMEEPSKVIRAGVTTKDEVIKHYGEPSRVSERDGSEELVYESVKVETPSYLGGLVINEAGRAITEKRLDVVIRDGVVQSYRFEAKGD